MSVNDKEMEVLLRRYAKNASGSTAHSEHLDADELSAFAEGALPAAARQRYVSHLADCDDCRKLAGELVVAQGGTVEARVPASEAVPDSWWRKLGALFSPPALRYAAFALVLVAVMGVSFLIWRRPTSRPSEMVAQSHPETAPVEAVKPAPSESQTSANARAAESPISKTSQPITTDSEQTRTTGTAAAPPPPPAKAGAEEEKPALAARAAEVPHVAASPSYAPQPPAEIYRSEDRVQEPRKAGEPAPSGPRRSDYDKNKAMDRAREGDVAKERDEDQKRAANQAVNENKDDSPATVTSSGTVKLSRRGIQEGRVETQKAEATEEVAESRSVGGRKFKRQGNAWVDSKFKSSMSVRNVARGSEEFYKLDSGLRSIAQQLGGEIVVVWKGKAYRIR